MIEIKSTANHKGEGREYKPHRLGTGGVSGGVVSERLLRVGVQGECGGGEEGLRSPGGGHELDFDSGPLRGERNKGQSFSCFFRLLDSTSLKIPLLSPPGRHQHRSELPDS